MSMTNLLTLLNATKLHPTPSYDAGYYSALSDSDPDRHPIII